MQTNQKDEKCNNLKVFQMLVSMVLKRQQRIEYTKLFM